MTDPKITTARCKSTLVMPEIGLFGYYDLRVSVEICVDIVAVRCVTSAWLVSAVITYLQLKFTWCISIGGAK